MVTVGIEGWRAVPGEGPDFGGVGARMAVTPGAGRGWAADPVLVFGVEAVEVDDGEDRGPAFVAGAGVRKDARRWTLQAEVLHRLLTVEEEPVNGVETGRDAALWEIRVAIGRILG
ncbi:MAG TPA: hypothetical protein VM778_05880 [Gemmatimonadota bacterium]|nr:hypothetical protein [Gemmatimonadota bacterium]